MPWSSTRPRTAVHGWAHRKARIAWARLHQPTDPCVRCHHPLGPMSPGLHLDHTDDHTGYLGFSHGTACPTCGRKCNVRAGSLAGNAAQKRRRQGPTTLTW